MNFPPGEKETKTYVQLPQCFRLLSERPTSLLSYMATEGIGISIPPVPNRNKEKIHRPRASGTTVLTGSLSFQQQTCPTRALTTTVLEQRILHQPHPVSEPSLQPCLTIRPSQHLPLTQSDLTQFQSIGLPYLSTYAKKWPSQNPRLSLLMDDFPSQAKVY